MSVMTDDDWRTLLSELKAIEKEWQRQGDYSHPDTLLEAVDEIDRLWVKSEWLTTLLGRALVYVDEANIPASWELGDAIRLAIKPEARHETL